MSLKKIILSFLAEKPLEPPIVFINQVQITSFDQSTPIKVYVHRAPGENRNNTVISAELKGVPENVTIGTGIRQSDTVRLNEEEMSDDIKMTFKGDQDDFKMKMIVSIASKSTEDDKVGERKKRAVVDNTKRSRTFEFSVTGKGSLQPKLDIPLRCFEKGVTRLDWNYTVSMARGSLHTMRLIIAGLPQGLSVDGVDTLSNDTYVIRNISSFDHSSFVVKGKFDDTIPSTFNFTATVSAAPAYGEVRKVIIVKLCNGKIRLLQFVVVDNC